MAFGAKAVEGARWSRENLIKLVGAVIVVLFVSVWAYVLIRTWGYTPTTADPKLILGASVVTGAGALATAVGALTASSLGFSVAEVQKDNTATGIKLSKVGDSVGAGVGWAILAYVVIGVAVFWTWFAAEEKSPEVLNAFGVSVLGWLLGGASAFFRTTPDGGTGGGGGGGGVGEEADDQPVVVEVAEGATGGAGAAGDTANPSS